jgi:hypothetical protein
MAAKWGATGFTAPSCFASLSGQEFKANIYVYIYIHIFIFGSNLKSTAYLL